MVEIAKKKNMLFDSDVLKNWKSTCQLYILIKKMQMHRIPNLSNDRCCYFMISHKTCTGL